MNTPGKGDGIGVFETAQKLGKIVEMPQIEIFVTVQKAEPVELMPTFHSRLQERILLTIIEIRLLDRIGSFQTNVIAFGGSCRISQVPSDE